MAFYKNRLVRLVLQYDLLPEVWKLVARGFVLKLSDSSIGMASFYGARKIIAPIVRN